MRQKEVGILVNINKLKGKIAEKGMSIPTLADKADIDKATIYRKISTDGEGFTVKQVDDICSVLELTLEEAESIFFAQYVS